jgi:cytochrome c-type biogenesis protein CcmE
MHNKWKFGVIIAVILVTLSWLAFTGIRDTKTYYVTVPELLQGHHGPNERLRVAGDVLPGSIKPHPGRLEFVLQQGQQKVSVVYIGTDPAPDTFVDGAQAMASGHLLPDGTFEATGLQAKCASKYEPKGVRLRPRRTSAGSSM